MSNMHELNEAWMTYFKELDPQKRFKLLQDLPDLEDGALDFCRTLYQQRYINPKHPDQAADTWLWKFVYLPGLFKRRRFLPGALKKEMQGTLKELCLEHPDELSDIQKTILYLEFRNAARRYLSTCKGDHYARKMLGLRRATDQEKRSQACEDIWMVSKGLAQVTGQEENLKLWCEALYTELLEYDPDSRKDYEELDAKGGLL